MCPNTVVMPQIDLIQLWSFITALMHREESLQLKYFLKATFHSRLNRQHQSDLRNHLINSRVPF